MTFDYEGYFSQYQTDHTITRADIWRIYYKELLRMHSDTVPHIADGNLLDGGGIWEKRTERFLQFMTAQFPIPPGTTINNLIGHLYHAHTLHSGRTRQAHNIEGTGFAYLTRALLIRFCELVSDQVRIAPSWTTLPCYTYLSGLPHIPNIKPDLAVIKTSNSKQDTYGIVSLKWTIRHDRLKNAMTEANEIKNKKRGGRPAFIAFLTNEYDTGRLSSAALSPQLNCVYHVSLPALRATYEGEARRMQAIDALVSDGVLKDAGDLFNNFK